MARIKLNAHRYALDDLGEIARAQALPLTQGEWARIVGRGALTSVFDEVFRMMGWVFVAALVLAPFCRPAPLPPPNAPKPASPVDAH